MNQHSGNEVRVLLVDDDPLVRAALRLMLEATSDIHVVAEAGDGAEVTAMADRHAPDVVLMDIRMPTTDGLTATRELRQRKPAPEVIVLTTFHADEYVLRALRAGAAGFLLKDTEPDDLVSAVRNVMKGRPVLSPEVTQQLIAHVSQGDRDGRQDRARSLLLQLSEREHEIALTLAEGKTNAEIAAALYLSIPAVKTHISRILTKLDLNNRVQIALLVHDAGSPDAT
ncbi:response regulator transcription factor [Streptomyces sp. L2]|uniref:response regulator transcription factor n=1 Tax=Streptomyces sp. L2 TaxID=2162665 RepID=UPI0010128349|nr:response regulator transcription factor [Streptomyces sp. L2]